jgi:hypothetical protein
MKQPRKLHYSEKQLLSKRGYDARQYMYCEEDDMAILVIHKETKQKEWVSK